MTAILQACENSKSERYQLVLDMHPVGYWPADDGDGAQLRDLSGATNNARLFNVPWDGTLLDFSSGYEFIEIPNGSRLLGKEFSLGVWVFSRREFYGREGVALIGSWVRAPWSFSLRLKGKSKLGVEINSIIHTAAWKHPENDQLDLIGSFDAGVVVAPNRWQHVFYIFKNGECRLYINGKVVQSKKNVPYKAIARDVDILAGYDADWWGVHPAGSQSLDGSLRHLVFFDRALSDAEVETLVSATAPETTPHRQAQDEVRIKGRFIALRDLGSHPAEVQREALVLMHKGNWDGDLTQNASVLRTYLGDALKKTPLRYDAALVLQKLDAFDILHAVVPVLAEIVKNREASPQDRASAALTLGAMGKRARPAVNTLMAAMEADLKRSDAHIPRVNDIVRNSLNYALLRIHRSDSQVRKLLGRAFAKPILDKLDLQQPYLAKARDLAEKDRYMDSLETCKGLLGKNGVFFLSQNDKYRDGRGNIHDCSYTAMAEYKGYTYKFGEGKSYAGCETITREVYEKALAHHSKRHPSAGEWLNSDVSLMRRANLQRIAPDGEVKTAYIGGENFIFSAFDAKVCSWVMAVDKKGYIHIMGGQHNKTSYANYMPGAWEEMGLSQDRTCPNYPTKMYWVSTRPEVITEFEFVGMKDNVRDVPVTYLNYMNFVQDNRGELYLYGRTSGWGFQSWGLFKYDTDTRNWAVIGGVVDELMDCALKHAPHWKNIICKQIYGIRDRSGPNLLGWAWQPHFYNYMRSIKGVQFDPENRMYVQVGIRGVDENARYSLGNLFAYSEDGGSTFRRADGSAVRLPLTNNPAPEHNADVSSDMNSLWIMQWNYLLKQAGY